MDLITAESQLNALVERRGLQADPEQQRVEDLFAESTRRHHAKLREQHRWEWIRFFDRMAESHARMSEDYQRRAAALLEEPGEGRLSPSCPSES